MSVQRKIVANCRGRGPTVNQVNCKVAARRLKSRHFIYPWAGRRYPGAATPKERNMDGEERKLHDQVGFVGLRAQATAVGFIQLCTELCRAGLLDEAAMGRIKEAIAKELALSRPRAAYQTEYEGSLKRLDDLFAGRVEIKREPPIV
jgi:hypothetical protein